MHVNREKNVYGTAQLITFVPQISFICNILFFCYYQMRIGPVLGFAAIILNVHCASTKYHYNIYVLYVYAYVRGKTRLIFIFFLSFFLSSLFQLPEESKQKRKQNSHLLLTLFTVISIKKQVLHTRDNGRLFGFHLRH